MKIRIDEALQEVWQMKEQVHNDFKNSKFDNFIDFINDDLKDFKLKYKIKNREKINEIQSTKV